MEFVQEQTIEKLLCWLIDGEKKTAAWRSCLEEWHVRPQARR